MMRLDLPTGNVASMLYDRGANCYDTTVMLVGFVVLASFVFIFRLNLSAFFINS